MNRPAVFTLLVVCGLLASAVMMIGAVSLVRFAGTIF